MSEDQEIKAGEWHPIETAPADTIVLVYDPTEGMTSAAGQINRRGVVSWYIAVSAGFTEDGSLNPTHWMLLPDPPA